MQFGLRLAFPRTAVAKATESTPQPTPHAPALTSEIQQSLLCLPPPDSSTQFFLADGPSTQLQSESQAVASQPSPQLRQQVSSQAPPQAQALVQQSPQHMPQFAQQVPLQQALQAPFPKQPPPQQLPPQLVQELPQVHTQPPELVLQDRLPLPQLLAPQFAQPLAQDVSHQAQVPALEWSPPQSPSAQEAWQASFPLLAPPQFVQQLFWQHPQNTHSPLDHGHPQLAAYPLQQLPQHAFPASPQNSQRDVQQLVPPPTMQYGVPHGALPWRWPPQVMQHPCQQRQAQQQTQQQATYLQQGQPPSLQAEQLFAGPVPLPQLTSPSLRQPEQHADVILQHLFQQPQPQGLQQATHAPLQPQQTLQASQLPEQLTEAPPHPPSQHALQQATYPPLQPQQTSPQPLQQPQQHIEAPPPPLVPQILQQPLPQPQQHTEAPPQTLEQPILQLPFLQPQRHTQLPGQPSNYLPHQPQHMDTLQQPFLQWPLQQPEQQATQQPFQQLGLFTQQPQQTLPLPEWGTEGPPQPPLQEVVQPEQHTEVPQQLQPLESPAGHPSLEQMFQTPAQGEQHQPTQAQLDLIEANRAAALTRREERRRSQAGGGSDGQSAPPSGASGSDGDGDDAAAADAPPQCTICQDRFARGVLTAGGVSQLAPSVFRRCGHWLQPTAPERSVGQQTYLVGHSRWISDTAQATTVHGSRALCKEDVWGLVDGGDPAATAIGGAGPGTVRPQKKSMEHAWGKTGR